MIQGIQDSIMRSVVLLSYELESVLCMLETKTLTSRADLINLG